MFAKSIVLETQHYPRNKTVKRTENKAYLPYISNVFNRMSSLTYGLKMASFVDRLFYEDECTIGMAYGGFLGTGKSSYCIKVEAEALGTNPGWPDNKPDYNQVKDYLDFPPKAFVERLLRMKRREKMIIWDDMGLWLFVLDWFNPFVKAVCKYMNVARTDWAFIFGNTPTPKMVAKRIHNFPEIIRVKISKEGSNIKNPGKPRIATAYQVWMSPDLKKTGVRKIFQDRYNAMMPDDFFKWYKPKRDYYATIAKQMMYKELTKLDKRDKEEVIEDPGFKEALPEPERVKELQEVIGQLEVGPRF